MLCGQYSSISHLEAGQAQHATALGSCACCRMRWDIFPFLLNYSVWPHACFLSPFLLNYTVCILHLDSRECVGVVCGLSHIFLNNTVWVRGRLLWPLSFYSEQHGVSVWTCFVASFSSEQHCVSVWTSFVASLILFWTTLCECVGDFCGLSHFIFYSE
jgi:hypothetical protein